MTSNIYCTVRAQSSFFFAYASRVINGPILADMISEQYS